MELEQGGLLRLGGAEGVVIGCTRGVVWITEEGDPRDHLVEAGGRHRVRSRGLVVAEALRDSVLWVCRPVRTHRLAPRLRHTGIAGAPA